jgi:hypothetical protein
MALSLSVKIKLTQEMPKTECLKCTKVPKLPKIMASLAQRRRLRRVSLRLLYKSLTLAVWEARNQNNEMTT